MQFQSIRQRSLLPLDLLTHHYEHQLMSKQQRVRHRVPMRRSARVHHHRTFETQFQTNVVELVETSSTQKHSDTCYKYCAKSRGEKRTCRASEFLF